MKSLNPRQNSKSSRGYTPKIGKSEMISRKLNRINKRRLVIKSSRLKIFRIKSKSRLTRMKFRRRILSISLSRLSRSWSSCPRLGRRRRFRGRMFLGIASGPSIGSFVMTLYRPIREFSSNYKRLNQSNASKSSQNTSRKKSSWLKSISNGLTNIQKTSRMAREKFSCSRSQTLKV